MTISQQALYTLLRELPQHRDIQVTVLETIDSTNDEAKRMITAGVIESECLIVANEQTAGRGQRGKTFYSPKDTGIYMSLVFRSPADDTRQRDCSSLGVQSVCGSSLASTETTYCETNSLESVTIQVARAVSDAISDVYDVAPTIKPINDLYLDGRKICGILCELYKGFLIIGIGVNISTSGFPQEIAKTAGSLKCITSDERSKEGLVAAIVDRIIAEI